MTERELLALVTPEALRALLTSDGWTKAHEVPGKTEWWRFADNEVTIPLDTKFSDYNRRISQAIEELVGHDRVAWVACLLSLLPPDVKARAIADIERG